MKTSTKIILAAAFISTVGISGLAKTVYAQPFLEGLKTHYFQNIKIVEGKGARETNDDSEKQESSQLQSLAKITSQQALQAVETAQNSKATSVKLENEDGNLVYTVVTNQKEVKVDAGNGQILQVEALGNENDDTYPRSSIQVPSNGEHKE